MAENFSKNALPFTRSPLGIIGLFIVLVYALATLTFTFANPTPIAQYGLLFLLVLFPFAILFVFFVLVTKHPLAMYAPGDYQDEANFLELQRVLLGAVDNGGATGSATFGQEEVKNAARRLNLMRNSLPDGKFGKLLWVDDNPENNIHLVDSFNSVGIVVDIAISTDQAIEMISKNKYFSIISDMGRKEGNEEGYVLLENIQNSNPEIPFYIYAGSSKIEHNKKTLSLGGKGNTNSGSQLFKWIIGDAVTYSIWH